MKLRYYTVHDLAEFIGVSDRTIERWFAQGRLTRWPHERLHDGTKLWTPKQAREMLAHFRKDVV